MIERKELVDILRRVAPALSGKDMIPVLGCFCFDGKSVLAYDDVLAIQFPYETEFQGAVKGSVLAGFLNSSTVRTYELDVREKELELKSQKGSSKLVLPLVSPDDFLFIPPSGKAEHKIKLPKEFHQVLQGCSMVMSSDPTRPWGMGVTLKSGKTGLYLYATNNKVIARGYFKLNEPDVNLLLPPQFITTLLSIWGKDDLESLLIYKDWLEARFVSGLKMFSRVSTSVDWQQYQNCIKEFNEQLKKVEVAPLPKRFVSSIDRSIVVIDAVKQQKFSTMKIKEGAFTLLTETAAGNVEDHDTLEGHPDAQINFSPGLVKDILPYVDSIHVLKGNRCFVLEGEAITFYVAGVQTVE